MHQKPDPAGAVDAAAERLAERFRTLSGARLHRLAPEGLALARELAAAAAGVEARHADGPPARRELPDEGPFVVGDQIAVAGHDLAAAARAAAAEDAAEVWTADGRRAPLDTAVAAALARLRALPGRA